MTTIRAIAKQMVSQDEDETGALPVAQWKPGSDNWHDSDVRAVARDLGLDADDDAIAAIRREYDAVVASRVADAEA